MPVGILQNVLFSDAVEFFLLSLAKLMACSFDNPTIS